MVKIKGFTLIEIMIVLAIIGILTSVVLGPMQQYRSAKTNDAEMVQRETADNEMVVNGVLHVCDDFGDCVPK